MTATAPVEIIRLFDELDGNAYLEYPSLTRDELFGLGDAPLIADSVDLAWWGGLTEQTRTELLASAQRGLLARGLVSLGSGGDLDVTPRLRTVLALRRAPAFVSLVGNVGHASPVLRCYGVLGPDNRVAILLEARIVTGVAENLFCAPGYAARVVARFALAPPDELDPDAVDGPAELGGRMVHRRLELFPPGVPTHGRRYLATAGVTGAALTEVDDDGRSGTSRHATEDTLARLVAESWTVHAHEAFAAAGGLPGDGPA